MSVLEVADGSGSDADGASTVQLKSGVTASGRQSRARGATPRELADMLAKLLGGGSVLLAMWVEVEEAALLPPEADAIAEPLARIINRSNWGKQVAKKIIGADDYLALSLALFAYGVRVYPLVQAKVSEQRASRPIQPTRSTPPPVRPAAPASQPERSQPGNSDGDTVNGVRFSGSAGFGFAESA